MKHSTRLQVTTVVHFSWANSTAKLLRRALVAALRSSILELKLAAQDWKEVIMAIRTVLNSARLDRLTTDPFNHPYK